MDYPAATNIEVYHQGRWIPALEVTALEQHRCRIQYRADYVFGAGGPPVSLTHPNPVAFMPARYDKGPMGRQADTSPEGFWFDMVPQGKGRKFLMDKLKLADGDQTVMPLVFAGAFNPIGCLRLQCAVQFYEDQVVANNVAAYVDGFALDDIVELEDDFVEHISQHSMLAAGTTGVQGVAPKFLLTTNAHGQWFADLALPDTAAHEHWLVKMPRGNTEEDRLVLRSEAAYLRVASAMGLRTQYEPHLHSNMLFVRRFDRLVDGQGLHRLHQESAASLAGLRWFEPAESQQQLLNAIRRVCDDPLAETIEFLKRDVLNQALRNTDNHARNTAVQRLPDGRVQLTPVFDFAPMYKDPELIARSTHWKNAQGAVIREWSEVVGQLQVTDAERNAITTSMRAFGRELESLPQIARDCGVEEAILIECQRQMAKQVEELGRLAP